MPAALQSTSLRLMYNLIETIFHRRADARTSELYRGLLSSVLECFVRKLGALRMQVARIVRCVVCSHRVPVLVLSAGLRLLVWGRRAGAALRPQRAAAAAGASPPPTLSMRACPPLAQGGARQQGQRGWRGGGSG